jgi:proteasome lid subunit RPN8/RPN11
MLKMRRSKSNTSSTCTGNNSIRHKHRLRQEAIAKMVQVRIKRSIIESLLDYAKACYPKEGILLLRGKAEKGIVNIAEIVVPPLSVRGSGFSNFPLHMLPIDFSIVGTMHSHPSGALKPSATDLNHFYGRIMIIVGYPYETEKDMIVLDGEGNAASYEIM